MTDTTDRAGEWIETISGPFWPADPRPEDIDIQSIARALSNLCRFGGHVKQFYSVAQHSVLCAIFAPPHLRLAALLHDASEAYLVDIPRPIKHMLPDYRRLEAQIEAVIAAKYNLPHPMPAELKLIDTRMLVTEAAQLMECRAGSWWREPHWPAPFPGLRIRSWTPRDAELAFTLAFANYFGTGAHA